MGIQDIFCFPLPISSPLLSYLSLCTWRLLETASAGLHSPLASHCFCQWRTPKERWAEEECGQNVYFPHLLPVGSLQVGCIPWPKVTASVEYPWVSWDLLIPCHFVPNCYYHIISLGFLIPPTAFKSPFIKLFSKYSIWDCHLFPTGALLGTVVTLGIIFEEAVRRRAFFKAQH